ncbi:chromosomal protein D1 [Drosophila ficusphila]|uniref:chromosomal protein D1 n=1 Tax=Drosophila ficusphila TaxID=30025 RepID=UPI0007E60618|nr:chromosomal protein D1 [Drosophila ficusphila]XP_017058706.1 chromosomal protein D1 [Drosophila ficusphila]
MEEVAVKKRGRPPKSANSGGSPAAAVASAGAKKRGRPAKNKGANTSVGGGSGQRGRPPKASKVENNDDEDEEEEENSEEELNNTVSPSPPKGRGRPRSSGGGGGEVVKTPGSAKKRKAGRPKKHQPSGSEDEDEQSDDDDGSSDEDRRPVGRPATGAVNLNISRSGRGLGRPKKRSSGEWNGDAEPAVPKKRGRPPQNKAARAAYVPTGRPRGRPKANAAPVEKQVAEDNGDDLDDEGSADEVHNAPEKTAVTPKKRGRPSLGGSKTPMEGTPKPRGRPPKVVNKDDADDADSTDQAENNSKKESNDEERRADGSPPPKGDDLKWNSDGDNDANEEYVSDVYNDSESVAA